MTVYYELDHDMKIPLVPIVQNCAVPPLVPVRRAYEFGKALGDGHPVLSTGCSGSRSSAPAACRTGSATRASVTSTRSSTAGSCERLERGELDQVLDMPDDEIELAGNGNHEMRTLAGGRRGHGRGSGATLAYEPVVPVDHRHGRRHSGRPQRRTAPTRRPPRPWEATATPDEEESLA